MNSDLINLSFDLLLGQGLNRLLYFLLLYLVCAISRHSEK